MKEILQLLLTALSLISRPRFNFACCTDCHIFSLSRSKLESREKCYHYKQIRFAPGHAYGTTEHFLISVLFWSRVDSQLLIIFLD